jgi:hypothetical protein
VLESICKFRQNLFYIHIYIQWTDKIIETINNTGISLCLAALEKTLVISDLLLFFCLFSLCISSVNELQVLFSNSMKEVQNEGNC